MTRLRQALVDYLRIRRQLGFKLVFRPAAS